jgi:hypothetical protein
MLSDLNIEDIREAIITIVQTVTQAYPGTNFIAMIRQQVTRCMTHGESGTYSMACHCEDSTTFKD